MLRFLPRYGTMLALAIGLNATPALAEPVQFDLVLKGLRAGTLAYDGSAVPGGTYAVRGQLKTSGLAAMLRKVRYDAVAKGQLTAKGTFVPMSYTEKADTGRRQSESVMAYVRGVPQVTSYNPPRAPRDYDVDPGTQGGTVDPLTAMFATLRDVDPGQECQVSLKMFDGRRASQIATSTPQARGDKVVCAGEYRRIAGFSAEDMAEKARFPFTLTYAPNGEGRMRVVEVAMDSLFGKARLVRR